MKFYVYAALVATVASEENVKCVAPEGNQSWEAGDVETWIEEEIDPPIKIGGAIDATSCKTAIDAVIEELKKTPMGEDPPEVNLNAFEELDYCFHAEVKESFTNCRYFAFYYVDENAKSEDIRVVTPATDGSVYSAWAYAKGAPLADLVAAADADSAKMITSALAAVATIAMVAY